MAAKASFSGIISISKVNFGVKAYSIVSEKDDLSLHMIHKSCGNPLSMPYHCKYCGVIVSKEETTKGFEHGGGWVSLDEESLPALELTLPENQPRVFQVHQTVREKQLVQPIKNYWLVPSSRLDERAYVLFRYALSSNKMSAIVTFVSHGRNHLAVLHPSKEGLSLSTIYYHVQVRTLADLGLEVAEVPLTKNEQAMAKSIIEGLARPFDYAEYPDENRVRKEQVINAVLSRKPVPVREYQQPAHMDSLISALEASIEALPSLKRRKGRPKK